MNSGSSAFIGSAGQCAVTSLTASCSQTSRLSFHAISPPVCLTTMTLLTPPAFSTAMSTLAFSGTLRPAAQAFVGGDDDLRLGALDAAGERVGREAAEYDRVDRADPRARRASRRPPPVIIGQIDRHPVALLDPMPFQHVGEVGDVIGELAVGDVLGPVRIVALPDDRGLMRAIGQMAVDAIVGDVGHAILEPFDRDVVRIERDVLDLGVGLEPMDPFALLAPEPVGVRERVRIHLFVLRCVDPGALGPIDGNFVHLLGHELLSRRPLAAALFSNGSMLKGGLRDKRRFGRALVVTPSADTAGPDF